MEDHIAILGAELTGKPKGRYLVAAFSIRFLHRVA